MLKKVSLDQLEAAQGGNSFARFGGFGAWSRSQRGAQYREFCQLVREGKAQFGPGREWGRQYAAYKASAAGGGTRVPAIGSRAMNLPSR